MQQADAIGKAVTRLNRIVANDPVPFNSLHEAHAYMREVCDDMWDAIRDPGLSDTQTKRKVRDLCELQAAFSMRTMYELL